jgi:hypothetical protein
VRIKSKALTRGPEEIDSEQRGNLKIIFAVEAGKAVPEESKLAHCV